MKHADLAVTPLDLANGEDTAHICTAANALDRALDNALEHDELGEGGHADVIAGLIALLAGQLDDDAVAYTADLLGHAARAVARSRPNIVGW